MSVLQQQWLDKLDLRRTQGNYRQLQVRQHGVDFCSNDYLGFARDTTLQQHIASLVAAQPRYLMGSTGSRLISGTSDLCQETETFIAAAHHSEEALIFPSGYKANLALFSCIAGRGDTILVDELIHRSVHDGCALSNALKWKFRHNDLEHLAMLLQKAKGNIFIAVETLYSMDGDYAPMKEILALAKQYNAHVIADEAHAGGVFGKGLIDKYGLQDDILATIVTYGKAFGLQGAAILGCRLLKDYLVNYGAPFIYSTAMPDVQLLSIKAAYEHLDSNKHLSVVLQQNIRSFREHNIPTISAADSPIQIIQFDETLHLKQVSIALKSAGYLVYPVYAPTVKPGSERLRICIHQFNTAQEINLLCNTIKTVIHG